MGTLLKELLSKAKEELNPFFDQIDIQGLENLCDLLYACKGMIVITGVGKSGLVAEKMAVTLISTGSRALFLSPSNALHGDLGIIRPEDVFLVLSKSGESDELLQLIPYVRNRGVKIASIVSNPNSRLARASDFILSMPPLKELCPFDMAPTTSTTAQGIICDVLSIALMMRKKITIEQFIGSHPAGRLGKRSTLKVSDLMLKGEALPLCDPDLKLVDSLVELSNKQCGCVLVIEKDKTLKGIFTDGDLRRALQNKGPESLNLPLKGLMSKNPRTIHPEKLAFEALRKMESDQKRPITVLAVVDEKKKVVGVIKMHDIIQSGI